MSKKKIMMLVSVIFVLVLFIAAKAYLKPSNINSLAAENNVSLKAQYNQLIKSGEPSMIIFSYDAECWPTTEVFFEEYNAKVKGLMEKYENNMGILFINVGILGETEYEAMREISRKNNVDELPSILLLDSKGEYSNVVVGEFIEEDIEKEIDKIIE